MTADRKPPREVRALWIDLGYYVPNGTGVAGTIYGWRDQPLPHREFPPGFHGANPGPSHSEPKPRYRVKAGSSRIVPEVADE